jgi:hypothetical protein
MEGGSDLIRSRSRKQFFFFNQKVGHISSFSHKKAIQFTTPTDVLPVSCPQDVLCKTILHPCIRLLSSTKVLFPSGSLSRSCLAVKLVDCLYMLSLRIPNRQILLVVPPLQRFFQAFDKVQRLKMSTGTVGAVSSAVETLVSAAHFVNVFFFACNEVLNQEYQDSSIFS